MAAANVNSTELTLSTTPIALPSITHREVIFLSSVNALSSFIGTFGNILVFLVVFKCRYLGWQKTEFFICSLAGSNLLLCLVGQPLYIMLLNKILRDNINIWRKTITWIATIASVSSLLTISIDRFLALLFLQKYRTMLKTRAAVVLVMLQWVFSFAIGISASSFNRTLRHVSQYFVIAALICLPVFYVGIFLIVRVQCTQMKKHFPTLSRTLGTFTREKRIAKLVAVVVGVFYVCYLPLTILPFFMRSRASFAWRILPWVNTLALCNSCVNPYIYYMKSWRFKNTIQNMNLGKARSKKRSERAANNIPAGKQAETAI